MHNDEQERVRALLRSYMDRHHLSWTDELANVIHAGDYAFLGMYDDPIWRFADEQTRILSGFMAGHWTTPEGHLAIYREFADKIEQGTAPEPPPRRSPEPVRASEQAARPSLGHGLRRIWDRAGWIWRKIRT